MKVRAELRLSQRYMQKKCSPGFCTFLKHDVIYMTHHLDPKLENQQVFSIYIAKHCLFFQGYILRSVCVSVVLDW